MAGTALWVVVLLALNPGQGQPEAVGPAPIQVQIRLTSRDDANSGQQTVKGKIALGSITVSTQHGTFRVPAGEVRSIHTASRSTEAGPVLRVRTGDDQEFEGVITSPAALEVDGPYGRIAATWPDLISHDALESPHITGGKDCDPVPVVEVVTEEGDKVQGPMAHLLSGRLDSVEIVCDFGDLAVVADQVRSIEFGSEPATVDAEQTEHRAGTITTTTGRKLTGVIGIPHDLIVESKLGLLNLRAGKLRSITFEVPTRPTPPPTSRSEPAGSPPDTRPAEGIEGGSC